MKDIKDGGPAFPSTHESMDPRNPGWVGGGLTIRDYFAAKGMHAALITAKGYGSLDAVIEQSSYLAYKIADAMLKAREE